MPEVKLSELEMFEMQGFRRCPFCGRKPKIKIRESSIAVAKCKPLFRKAHMEVYMCGKSSELIKALTYAWNKEADKINARRKIR